MAKKARDMVVDIYGTALTITMHATGDEIRIDAETLSRDIIQKATMHGLKQKICDAAAIARSTVTGASASATDKFLAMRKVADALERGEWNRTRESGDSILLRAVLEYKAGSDPANVRTWFESKSAAERAKIRAIPAVQAIIARLESAMAGEVDEEELFDGLDD